jgi:hypothetical protein
MVPGQSLIPNAQHRLGIEQSWQCQMPLGSRTYAKWPFVRATLTALRRGRAPVCSVPGASRTTPLA